ncbi:MAG: hypothetical protein K2K56_06880, partial [Lachnospiraceae bacterium]|nr:hypothetical protein [Lachnospiraceae bacterium]
MTEITAIFIVAAIIVLTVTFIKYLTEKYMEQKKYKNIDYVYYDNKGTNMNDTTTKEDISESEYNRMLLKQLQSININLIDIQTQLSKQNKMLNEIKSNVGIITAITVIPIIIGIFIFVLSASKGYSMLENFTNNIQNIYNT